MKKLTGISVFLLLLYAVMLSAHPGARTYQNHVNVGGRVGLDGILTLAVALVIVTGHIDLSLASVAVLCATVTSILLLNPKWNLLVAEVDVSDPHLRLTLTVIVVTCLGLLIGVVNGLIVTYLHVQAFIVTLCGMFVYRGVARLLSAQPTGLPMDLGDVRQELIGTWFGVPAFLAILLVLLAAAAIFLHASAYGRYFFALGSNERAAKFSGIAVDFYKVSAFALCSMLTALFSILWLFKNDAVQPSNSLNMAELYAIAGAVLGGFSLRGGDGNVLGILLGATVICILPTMTDMLGFRDAVNPVVIGLALLVGAILDEFLRRRRGTR